jgi:3-oxoacyl-[acyl-carrier-protein] synthase II
MNKMRMAIEGLGVAGGFGSGIGSLEAVIKKGHIEPSRSAIETGEGQKDIPVFQADLAGLEEFFQERALRRIDHHSKLAIFAASMALKDAGRFSSDQGNTGVVVATGYGPHGTIFAFLDSFSSPTYFANSVHNAAAAYTAIFLKTAGPSLTVSLFEMSVSSALLTAWCWLREGWVDRVLFGAVDDFSPVLGYCYYRFFGFGDVPVPVMEPLDFEKQTAIPGEAGVFFLLSTDENRAKHGFITGIANGFAGGNAFPLPIDQQLIIGADGHKDTGVYYAVEVAGRRDVRCYTSLYGSLPTGQALDVAIAALSMKEKEAFTCLKIGRAGEIGLVVVQR